MFDESQSDEDYIPTLLDEQSDDTDIDTDISEPSTSIRPRRIINQQIREQPEPDSSSSSWMQTEKRQLFCALKDFGTSSVRAVKSRIPTKSETEIKEYLGRKRKAATSGLKPNMGKQEGRMAPIDKWIEYLCKIMPNEDYKLKCVGRLFKYIALFEDREEDNQSESGINLQDCYLILSSLLTGEGPKYSNRETSYFLYTIFQEFAKEIKGQDYSMERKILQTQYKPATTRCYGKKKKVSIGSLDNLILNPLQVPEDNLRN